jgi:hypothetical protein
MKDYVIFATGAMSWNVGPFRSDAKLLFFRSESQEITSLGFCMASFDELDGRMVFSSSSPIERLEWTRIGGLSASQESLKFSDQELLGARIPVP